MANGLVDSFMASEISAVASAFNATPARMRVRVLETRAATP